MREQLFRVLAAFITVAIYCAVTAVLQAILFPEIKLEGGTFSRRVGYTTLDLMLAAGLVGLINWLLRWLNWMPG